MDQIKAPADALRAEIASVKAVAPSFLRKTLDPTLIAIDAWVQSVEARLIALQKMPSADAIAGLNAGPIIYGCPENDGGACTENCGPGMPLCKKRMAKLDALVARRMAKLDALATRGNCEDCE